MLRGVRVFSVDLDLWPFRFTNATRTAQVLGEVARNRNGSAANPVAEAKDPAFIQMLRLLPSEEQNRITRYAFYGDALRALVGSVLTRRALASVAGASLEQIHISRTEQNKPYWDASKSEALSLEQRSRLARVSFNLSHYDKWVILAVSACGSVGCDVATIAVPGKPMPGDEFVELMSSSLGPEERKYVQDPEASPEVRLSRYFVNWALKESFVKLIGEGLTFEAQHIEFPVPIPAQQQAPSITRESKESTGGTEPRGDPSVELVPREMITHADVKTKYLKITSHSTTDSVGSGKGWFASLLSSWTGTSLESKTDRTILPEKLHTLTAGEWNIVKSPDELKGDQFCTRYALARQHDVTFQVWMGLIPPSTGRHKSSVSVVILALHALFLSQKEIDTNWETLQRVSANLANEIDLSAMSVGTEGPDLPSAPWHDGFVTYVHPLSLL